jgi:hypothetical protein
MTVTTRQRFVASSNPSAQLSSLRPRQTTRRLIAAAVAGIAVSSLAPTCAVADSIWIGGTGNWSVAGNWTGGVPNSATASAFIDSNPATASVVVLDIAAKVNALTIDNGDTVQDRTESLTVYGGATINGLLNLSHGGVFAFGGTVTQTLGGSGVVNFSPPESAGTIRNSAAATVTIGPGLLIHGAGGTLDGSGTASGGFLNQGTIAADIAGGTITLLSVTNAGTVRIQSGAGIIFANSFTNLGVINLSSGTLTLGSGTSPWRNLGVINATGGIVNLGGTFTPSDIGTINRTGEATIKLTGTLNNVGQTFNLDPAAFGSLTLSGGTIRGGTVSASGGAGLIVSSGTVDAVSFLPNTVAFTTEGLSVTPTPALTVLNGLTLKDGAVLDATPAFGERANQILFAGSNAQTLAGNGAIFLGGDLSTVGSTLYNYKTTNTLTIGPGIQIHGKNGHLLDFGPTDGSFLLQGTVSAEYVGGTIEVANFTNTGTLQAINRGGLRFLGNWHNAPGGVINIGASSRLDLGGTFTMADLGTFTRGPGSTVSVSGLLLNAGSTLALSSNTGSFSLASFGTIRGGTVTGSDGALLQLNGGTLDGVTLTPTSVSPTGSSSFSIRNGLTLTNGTVLSAELGGISFAGTNFQTLGGDGQLQLAGGSFSGLGSLGSGVFAHGYGRIGVLLLQGTVLADVPGQSFTLTSFTNTGSIQTVSGANLAFGGQWKNSGTITLAAGSTLTLDGNFTGVGTIIGDPASTVNLRGTLDNTGSTLDLAATGPIHVTGGMIRGGTFTGSAANPLFISGATLDGVTLSGAGATFEVQNAQFFIRNGLTLSGGAAIDTAGGTNVRTGVVFFSGTNAQTLGGQGEVNFGSSTSSYTYFYRDTNPATLTLGPGIFVHGKFAQLNYTGSGGGLINQGTIVADVPGGNFVFTGSVTNQGTIQAVDGAGLQLNTTRFVQTAGTLRSSGDVPNGGALQITGGSASLGSLSGTGSLTLGSTAPGPMVPMMVNSFFQSAVTIHSTGALTLNPSAGRLTSTVGTLALDGAATLDLAHGELLITATPPDTIKSYLASAYDSGTWSKPGLTSGVATGDPQKYGVAYAYGGDPSAQDAAVKLHDGTPLGATQTLVRAVLAGDANLDGTVDFFDITQLLGYKYNTGQPASYTDGDLNYDGVVDFFDLTVVLSANYNTGQTYLGSQAGPAALTPAAAAVPEPLGLSLVAIGAAGMSARRRRKGRRMV